MLRLFKGSNSQNISDFSIPRKSGVFLLKKATKYFKPNFHTIMINNIPYGSVSTRITVPNPIELRNKTKEPSDNHLEEEDVMTLQQVSEWLGLSDEDLKKMAKADCIPVFHPAKNCFFFSRRDLLAWLEENKRGRIKKTTNTTNEEE